MLKTFILYQTLKWRADNKIDTILNEDFSNMREDFVIHTDSHDKKGRPIVAVNIGHWDLRAVVLQGRIAQLLRYFYWFHEILLSKIVEAQQRGEHVTRGILLVDLDGYNFYQQTCPACEHN